MQPGKIPVDINNIPDSKCKKCGNEFFRQVFKVKNVPKLLSPGGQGGELIFPVMICDSCSTPITPTEVVLPNQDKSKLVS